MPATDYSLPISVVSLLVSAFVAGWAVYRDVIQKPKFRVSVAVKSIFQEGRPKIGPDFYVSALNLGPLPNRIGLVFARPSWFDRKWTKKLSAHVMHDPVHPGNTARAQKVEVGDEVNFVFPINPDFLPEEFSQIGVTDGYGRVHWASRKQLEKVRVEVRKVLARAAV